MRFLRSLLVLGISVSATCVFAQDITNFTQFFINPYTINPSYAGIEGRSAFFLTYRKQWATIEGGPTIANLSYHTPLSVGLNLGLNVANDTRGVISSSSFQSSVAYSLAFENQVFLRFGISAGISYNGVDLEKLEEFSSDPAIAELLDNNLSITGNAGISFHAKSFHIGASLPTIFAPSYVSTDAFTITEVKPFQAIVLNASNRLYFGGDKHVFEPYVLYRINTGLPSQYEVAGVLHLNHLAWIGGSYKQDFGISALGGLKVGFLSVGASYSLKNSGINELNSPSFEVQLSYLGGKRKKNTPMYSFVNTEKEKIRKTQHKSASEVIAEKRRQDQLAQKKQQEDLAKKKADEAKQKELPQQQALAKKQPEPVKPQPEPVRPQPEPVKPQPEPVKPQPVAAKPQPEPVKPQPEPVKPQPVAAKPQPEPVKPQPVIVAPVVTPQPQAPKPVARHDGGPRLKSESFNLAMPNYDTAHHEEQARMARLEEHAENPTEHHEDPVDFHPNAERHEFVKKGSHKDELDYGDYVIVGVFKSEANSKNFADGLDKMDFKADYGHLSEKNLWYVYIAHTNDINKAKTERDKYRKMKIFKDAWLLTVHD
ncbi:MAG: PorP/SprF family type IX secretion system membrane protein [Cyclobacteriaceae bacterium]